MKKIFLLLIISIIMIAKVNADIISDNKVFISSNEYNNLVNLGFSDEEIDTMSYDIYLENEDILSELIDKQIKYYKTIYIYIVILVQ